MTRLLVCGGGRRGTAWVNAATQHPRVDLVGVVDPSPSARAAARARGVAAWRSLEQALPAAAAEAVVIASPPATHPDEAVAAVEAGVAAVVEKPLALSLAQAARVARASEATGVPVLVGHNFRYLRRERAISRVLERGRIGPVTASSIVAVRAGEPHGDPLWDTGVHHLDLLRLRFGGAPAAVRTDRLGGSCRVALEWTDGRWAFYQQRDGSGLFQHYQWLEGTRGALRAVDGAVWLVSRRHRPLPVLARQSVPPEAAILAELERARAGRATPLAAASNLATVATVEAAVMSAAQARPVALAEIVAAAGLDHLPDG